MNKIVLTNSINLPIGFMVQLVISETPCLVVGTDDSLLATLYSKGTYHAFINKNRNWDFVLKQRDCPVPPPIHPDCDPVNNPKHYNSSKATCDGCGEQIECIEITRHMSFNIGNAVKYLWRFEHKGGLEDLKKAQWYLNDAVYQLENQE